MNVIYGVLMKNNTPNECLFGIQRVNNALNEFFILFTNSK
jgi:hypothetical protein